MKKWIRSLMFIFMVGCAGIDRDCSSCNASNFGADWIVVQYGFDGTPINCWKLSGTAISNEDKSDGIFWTGHGHLVHISGWYNRIQVDGGRFEEAAKLIGVDLSRCNDGVYGPKVKSAE